MRDDSSFNKTCIVSPGLELRRVKSFISQTGAKHVVLVYFPSDPPPGNPAYPTPLMEQLADVRRRLAAALKEDVVSVGEIECPDLSTEGVAAFILALVARLRLGGAGRVGIGLGTGHTLFKMGAMIAASMDHEVELKYGHAHDYLEVHAVELARLFERGPAPDGRLSTELLRSLEALAQFAEGGGSGSTVGPSYVPALRIRAPTDKEQDVLLALHAHHGQARSYAGLLSTVLAANPAWPERPAASAVPAARRGRQGRGQTTATAGKMRTCAGRDMTLAGFVRVDKDDIDDKEVHIRLTELGALVTRVLKRRDHFNPEALSVKPSA